MADRRNLNTNEIALEETKFWLKVWQECNMFILRIVAYMQGLNKALQSFTLRLVDEFCHANNKLVMFENFAKLDSPRRLVQFWENLQTSLVLLIPNCTRQRMIAYTN